MQASPHAVLSALLTDGERPQENQKRVQTCLHSSLIHSQALFPITALLSPGLTPELPVPKNHSPSRQNFYLPDSGEAQSLEGSLLSDGLRS